MVKRIISVLLTVIIVFSFAAAIDTSASTLTLAQLRSKFPNGKYWNHVGSKTNNPNGYTSKPCTHHGSCDYDGSCGCNSFDGAIQCYGFVLKLAYDAYGVSGRKRPLVKTLSGVKPGDIVIYKGYYGVNHYIFVTKISGSTVYFADCNGTGGKDCKIRWNGSKTMSELKSKLYGVLSAPKALGSESGGSTEEDTTVKYLTDTYTVSAGGSTLNLRSGAGTSYDVVATVPDGTALTVIEINGEWGKTQYGGIEGWCNLEYAKVAAPKTCAVTAKATDITVADDLDLTFNSDARVEYVVKITLKNSVETSTVYKGTLDDNALKTELTLGGKYSVTVTARNSSGSVTSKAVDVNVSYCTGNYSVTASSCNLNIRKSASSSSDKLGSLSDGTQVKVTAINGIWGKITYGKITGWICLDYTKFINPETEQPEETICDDFDAGWYTITVTDGTLSLYGEANTESLILESIPDNTDVLVTAVEKNFGKITYNDKEGWICLERQTYMTPQPVICPPPSNFTVISSVTELSSVNSEITFTFTCKNAETFEINILRDSMPVDALRISENTFVYTPEEPGIYAFDFFAVNEEARISGATVCVAVIPVLDGCALPGDLNSDKLITLADAMLLFRYVGKVDTGLTLAQMSAADYDGNGQITLSDAMAVFRIVARVAI